MKKYFFVLLCAAVVGLTGCNKLNKSVGCLNGHFSVAEGKYVRFSMGNLQYTQSTKTWSFAEHQYDFIGTDNVTGGTVESDKYGYGKIGEALADKIDLFGLSGSTGSTKWGIGTSEDYGDYSGDFVDWGQNVISNGGNKANQWRTLTYDEWEYLLNTRADASSLQGVARINLKADGSKYANGLILLPDNWAAPTGITFKSGLASEWSVQAYANYQTFTLDQWSKLEKSGAVFFPASGGRLGTIVFNVGYRGGYWATTSFGKHNVCHLYFNSVEAYMRYNTCVNAEAVRLVQDVK